MRRNRAGISPMLTGSKGICSITASLVHEKLLVYGFFLSMQNILWKQVLCDKLCQRLSNTFLIRDISNHRFCVTYVVMCLSKLWPSDGIWWHKIVNIGSGNGLVPGGTKPLPEPMLSYRKEGPVTFIWRQFHKRYLRHQSLKVS